MKKAFRIFFNIVLVLYPVIIFVLLVLLKLPLKILSLCVIAFAAAIFLNATAGSRKEKKPLNFRPIAASLLFLAAGLLCFLTNEKMFLKLYPMAISLILLLSFGSTLFRTPNMIFRFATLADKSIKGSFHEKEIEKYCRKVTLVWCTFFVFNGTIATPAFQRNGASPTSFRPISKARNTKMK